MKRNTYLNFGGNCEQAFRFYEQHLGGKMIMMSRFGQMPDQHAVPPGYENAVLRARMEIGGTVLLWRG